MKSRFTLNKILIGLLLLVAALQLFRPDRNEGSAYTERDILHYTQVPDDVRQILEKSCYDCHSDHTNYPWYTHIQPVGLWLQNHVTDGKKELNFSQFASYKPKRQKHKMEEIIELVREGEMPLESYTLLHKKAVLSPRQQNIIIHWAESVYNGITLVDEEVH